jgi:hypothetical protein
VTVLGSVAATVLASKNTTGPGSKKMVRVLPSVRRGKVTVLMVAIGLTSRRTTVRGATAPVLEAATGPISRNVTGRLSERMAPVLPSEKRAVPLSVRKVKATVLLVVTALTAGTGPTFRRTIVLGVTVPVLAAVTVPASGEAIVLGSRSTTDLLSEKRVVLPSVRKDKVTVSMAVIGPTSRRTIVRGATTPVSAVAIGRGSRSMTGPVSKRMGHGLLLTLNGRESVHPSKRTSVPREANVRKAIVLGSREMIDPGSKNMIGHVSKGETAPVLIKVTVPGSHVPIVAPERTGPARKKPRLPASRRRRPFIPSRTAPRSPMSSRVPRT